MVVKFIAGLGIDHFGRTLACHAAGYSTDCCTSRHAKRPAHSTNCCASHCTTGRANSLAQVMVGKIVACIRVDHLCCALACQTTSDGANDRTTNRADRTGNRTDRRTGQCTGASADARADHMLALAFLELVFKMRCVIVGTGRYAHQDATVLDAFFIVANALFRNAVADQRTDDATGGTTSAGAGDCSSQRACHDQTKAWYDQRGTDGGDGRNDRT